MALMGYTVGRITFWLKTGRVIPAQKGGEFREFGITTLDSLIRRIVLRNTRGGFAPLCTYAMRCINPQSRKVAIVFYNLEDSIVSVGELFSLNEHVERVEGEGDT